MQLRITFAIAACSVVLGFLPSQAMAQPSQILRLPTGLRATQDKSSVEIMVVAPNIVRVDVQPDGVHDAHTPVLDPAYTATPVPQLRIQPGNGTATLATREMSLLFDSDGHNSLLIRDAKGDSLLSVDDIFAASASDLHLHRFQQEPLYGMCGIDRNVANASLSRGGDVEVKAGSQGNGGAPMFFTRSFGVLIDSVDGQFDVDGLAVSFSHNSRHEIEFYILVGPPLRTMQGIADLTGHSPMPPRWTLGFINSQWGIDEPELLNIVAKYRATHTPLDGFIIDYDWKAWGEDNYGEWRWNSTTGTGNVAPDKFPDGASGELARNLAREGVHLGGILKPRILLYKPGSTSDLDIAASYAQQHDLWYQGEPESDDTFTNRPSRDLDFTSSATRVWYWQHLEPSFDAGITAWWNDEADQTTLPNNSTFYFKTLQFFDMGRTLYDGQRAHSNVRVWSLNRNFYLGAQRYGYAEWSGDIKTGQLSMSEQPARMLATIDLGEPHWSMDTGGFIGHPSPEVYARWMEFAAFTPIFRVHGNFGEKRQPWVYGSVAEAVARHAMLLRYELLPYIYSGERTAFETGVGLVRPLAWIFSDDATAARQTQEWMFGDALLVAPILDTLAKVHAVYLPQGRWWDRTTGKAYQGPNMIALPIDQEHWSDLPIFVREGSIVATAPPGDDTDVMHPDEVTLDIYPSEHRVAKFTFYDDDGTTYDYEKGVYYRQEITASRTASGVQVQVASPTGSFQTSLRTYLVRVHGTEANNVRLDGHSLHRITSVSCMESTEHAWVACHDAFGATTQVRLKAGRDSSLTISVISN